MIGHRTFSRAISKNPKVLLIANENASPVWEQFSLFESMFAENAERH
jgi:hypothetical protein